jgi:hypothetical protein
MDGASQALATSRTPSRVVNGRERRHAPGSPNARRLIMKRMTWAALLGPLALVACQAGGEAPDVVDRAAVDVRTPGGSETLGGPFNCVGQCAWGFRLCVLAGIPREDCAPERDACVEECKANTCEPGDPDCCGFPGAEC